MDNSYRPGPPVPVPGTVPVVLDGPRMGVVATPHEVPPAALADPRLPPCELCHGVPTGFGPQCGRCKGTGKEPTAVGDLPPLQTVGQRDDGKPEA